MKKSIVLLCFLLAGSVIVAQQIPPKPNPPRLVNDLADVLSADEEQRLESKLVAYDDTTSTQIAIVLVRTLNDYPIEEYALAILREWGVGNKTTNNGAVIVAAIDDRNVRIETGYGLEGAVPDITASQIIREDIAPNFRQEDYYEGLDQAVESIIQAAAGEYKAVPKQGDGEGGGFPVGGIILAIIIFIFIMSRINRGGGGGGGFASRRGYRDLTTAWILGSLLSGMGRSRGGGWGSGGGWSGGGGGFGGGFGGFGGGSGGGGGASGSW